MFGLHGLRGLYLNNKTLSSYVQVYVDIREMAQISNWNQPQVRSCLFSVVKSEQLNKTENK